MIDKVKIQITEEEWAETPVHIRKRILQVMKERGCDTKPLEVLEKYMEDPTIDDIYNQFYGDEE